MSVKISSLEIENVKRVKAVSLSPTANGLTVIGGKNGQGKTSVLDAIAWTLGGSKFAPSQPAREGSLVPPHLVLRLSNGIVVERKGKNSALKVIDPNGTRSGQALLDSFISQFALDLPKFMNATNKEKANILLQALGVGDRLYELETAETQLYNKRHTIGQIADSKKKHADEMPEYTGVPNTPVSPSELIRRQQEILAKNADNQRKRENLARLEKEHNEAVNHIDLLEAELEAAQLREAQLAGDLLKAKKTAEQLVDESTKELERSIAEVEETNRRVSINLEKARASREAEQYKEEYKALTADLEDVRKQKYDLLHSAELPLEGLSVEDRELTYNGYKWDNMSGSEQLRAATAIVRKMNPNCGFVLIDKLEQMDTQTLEDFGKWLENEGLQAIATRVSTGDECSILIEDGFAVQPEPKLKQWKAGTF